MDKKCTIKCSVHLDDGVHLIDVHQSLKCVYPHRADVVNLQTSIYQDEWRYAPDLVYMDITIVTPDAVEIYSYKRESISVNGVCSNVWKRISLEETARL